MKIENLKSTSYSRGAQCVCALVEAANQLQVTNALSGKDELHIYADNEGEDKLVEVIQGYQYLSTIINIADGLYEVYLTDEPRTLQSTKDGVLSRINEYDKIEAVNGFVLDGRKVWLDRDTRVSVINSISLEKAAGKETTFRWLGGAPYTIPVDVALEMLAAVEMYATETYNVTQAHIAAVNLLDDIEQVLEYDYRVGYPEQLVFSLNGE